MNERECVAFCYGRVEGRGQNCAWALFVCKGVGGISGHEINLDWPRQTLMVDNLNIYEFHRDLAKSKSLARSKGGER